MLSPFDMAVTKTTVADKLIPCIIGCIIMAIGLVTPYLIGLKVMDTYFDIRWIFYKKI